MPATSGPKIQARASFTVSNFFRIIGPPVNFFPSRTCQYFRPPVTFGVMPTPSGRFLILARFEFFIAKINPELTPQVKSLCN